MKPSKRKRLERAGFKVGTVKEFLGLSDTESAMIELKIRLIKMLKSARTSHQMTQQELATLLSSSQSRVAKMEAGSADVSVDLICRALIAMNVRPKRIATKIASKRAA